MMRPQYFIGQAILYALFAGGVGYLSTSPVYSPIDPGQAMIKLSFSHAGKRAGECRRLSPEEIARLPPNMRHALDCPRGRLPVLVELEMDGGLLVRRTLQASGLSHDRASSIYQKVLVPPGRHRLTARLRDSARTEGFDYERSAEITLAPQQNLVIDFHAENGGFLF
jgi:hypothetical protein